MLVARTSDDFQNLGFPINKMALISNFVQRAKQQRLSCHFNYKIFPLPNTCLTDFPANGQVIKTNQFDKVV